MSPFEYVLSLVSVLVGLAVADLVVSLHRLVRARRRVRWDWLPLAAALLAALAVLEVWWLFFSAQDANFYTTLGGFLGFGAQLLVLFLLTAAALPDEVPAEGLDLREFYEDNAPYFWTLYAVYVGFVIIVRLVSFATGELSGSLLGTVISLPNLVLLALFITLARVSRRWLHMIAVVAVIGLLLVEWSTLRLAG